MIILADSTGEGVLEIPWGYTLPFTDYVGGEGFQSVTTETDIYSCISRYYWPEVGTAPCLIKTLPSGESIIYTDLIANTANGKASTITKLSDSTFIIGAWYAYSTTTPTLSVLKTDTLGAVLNEKVLSNTEYIPKDAMLTRDKKYLITALDFISNKYLFYLWKLDQNLNYDSIYTQPLVYDSLCPHPVTSSALFFQCDLLVGTNEPVTDLEKVRMHAWPNPANAYLHIELPEYISENTETTNLTVTTIHHKWYVDTKLDIFDLFGNRVFDRQNAPSDRAFGIDVSCWRRGMYICRLTYKGRLIASEKVILE